MLAETKVVASALALFAAMCFTTHAIAASPRNVRPGHGYPGRLENYAITPELQRLMDRFALTAGWFRRDSLPPEAEYHFKPAMCPANELPYLLFSPKRGRKPVPMVLYFGGTGEHGTNLVDRCPAPSSSVLRSAICASCPNPPSPKSSRSAKSG